MGLGCGNDWGVFFVLNDRSITFPAVLVLAYEEGIKRKKTTSFLE
jgi:hypothetical protein